MMYTQAEVDDIVKKEQERLINQFTLRSVRVLHPDGSRSEATVLMVHESELGRIVVIKV